MESQTKTDQSNDERRIREMIADRRLGMNPAAGLRAALRFAEECFGCTGGRNDSRAVY